MDILIVEDDDAQFNTYIDWVDEFNDENNNININIQRSTTAKGAKEKLEELSFHAVVIDLNLLGDNPEVASGNDVIRKILNDYRIPIRVVSGNLQNCTEESYIKENAFFKKYSRDESNNDIFNELVQIYKTGVLNIVGGTGEIERNLNQVFWNHLAENIDGWFNSNNCSEKALLRYTLNHLNAYLIKEDDRSFHEAEFYLIPPVKPNVSSGDIIYDKTSKRRFLLLSPACDVETRESDENTLSINAKSLVLSEIIDVDPKKLLEAKLITNNSKNQFKPVLTKAIKGTDPKLVYLPNFKEVNAGIVDFQSITSFTLDEFMRMERIATVSESFFKNIQSQFSSYYARQGQPDVVTLFRTYRKYDFYRRG